MKLRNRAGVKSVRGLLEPKKEHSTVSTLAPLASSKMTARAVDSLYLEIPNVHDGNEKTGDILEIRRGRTLP